MKISDELLKWQQLRQSGAITEEEFNAAKARLLAQADDPEPSWGVNEFFNPSDAEAAAKQWALFLHLSQYAGAAVPFAGLIVPIVIWQMKKEEFPIIDEHGKVVANWTISMIIYFVASILLTFVLIGIPLLFIVGAMALIYPAIGAVKANSGEVWPYPLSIKFF